MASRSGPDGRSFSFLTAGGAKAVDISIESFAVVEQGFADSDGGDDAFHP